MRTLRSGEGWWREAALGALSGAAASWLMEKAQSRIGTLGSDETKARERRARDGLEPATVRVAEAAARAVGRPLPKGRKSAAGEVVHYATGAAFGAAFGLLARRASIPVVAAGAAYGFLVWLVNDEGIVPALGFSRTPWHYPASTHVKALASHLVYGTATDAGFRLLGKALHLGAGAPA